MVRRIVMLLRNGKEASMSREQGEGRAEDFILFQVQWEIISEF